MLNKIGWKKLFTIRTIPTDVQDFSCWFVPSFYLTVLYGYLGRFCANFIFSHEEVQYLRTDVACDGQTWRGVACDEECR